MKIKSGFIVNDIFYEDESPEQETLLKLPITKEDEGTLLGYIKEIYQKGI